MENKHGQEGILIHEGSLVKYLKGCIGIGKNMPGMGKTEGGEETKKKLLEYVKRIIEMDRKNNETTNIKVKVIDPESDDKEEKSEKKITVKRLK